MQGIAIQEQVNLKEQPTRKNYYWRNRTRILLNRRELYRLNPNPTKLRRKKYCHNNHEKIINYSRQYNNQNKQLLREKGVAFYWRNPELKRLKARLFYNANKGRINAEKCETYHKQKKYRSVFWNKDYFCQIMNGKYPLQKVSRHKVEISHRVLKKNWDQNKLWLGTHGTLLRKANSVKQIQEINERLFPPWGGTSQLLPLY